jgi:hypothetical protein
MNYEVSPKFSILNEEVELKISPEDKKIPDSFIVQIKVFLKKK